MDAVASAAARGAPCSLECDQPFVAWNGVLVLAYTGFPRPLCAVKAHLPGEDQPGSKWPKTTLAARDDAAGPLALGDLQKLKQVCLAHANGLRGLSIPLAAVSLATYEARSLEGCQRRDCALPGEACSDVGEQERAAVRRVLCDWDDEEQYLAKANLPGSRIGSYRDQSPSGQTCVMFLDLAKGAGDAAKLAEALGALRADVDALGLGYHWLDPGSWHCTLRAL